MTPKIAWIDDDTSIIEPLVKPLQDKGYEFQYFNTVKEALDGIKSIKTADLVLLDMILPFGEMNKDPLNPFPYPGLFILRELRKVAPTLPIIILSVVTHKEAVKNAMQEYKLEVSAVLQKPLRPSVLRDEVQKALGK
jgi:DNA-binding NtrC family response regulator